MIPCNLTDPWRGFKISWYLGFFHTTPEKFENAAFFLWLRLPFTLIRHENGAFRKRSSTRKNLKTLALRFSVDRNQFENGASSKRWHRNSRVTSLHEFTLKTYLN